MKKELPHFTINGSYGGNQQWFKGLAMKLGGCAAETACDICIYLDLYKGTNFYPYNINRLNRSDYIDFAEIMKPYLHPRMGGIDKLSIFTEGFGQYLKSVNGSIKLFSVDATEPFETAMEAMISHINNGFPIAFLCLKHKNKQLNDYNWHWFLLNGYEIINEKVFVKAVTYSSFKWLDFEELWNSGYSNRGGMVCIGC